MARDDATPTEMPEHLFRQTGDYREMREIARQAKAARAAARAEAAIEHVAATAGPAGAPLIAFSSLMAGRRRTIVALVALAIAAWLVAIAAGMRWGGMV